MTSGGLGAREVPNSDRTAGGLCKATSSTDRQPPPNNQLLASLPPAVGDVLQSRLDAMDVAAGTTLHEAGTIPGHVYFPITAIVSLVSPLQAGARAEVAVVGRQGVVGVCAFMGGGNASSRAVVQRAGSAWRLRDRDIADLARDSAPAMPACSSKTSRPSWVRPRCHHMTDPETLQALTYVSSARGPMTGAGLQQVLQRAPANNQRDGLTGVLLRADGSFMQHSEGQPPSRFRTSPAADSRAAGNSRWLVQEVGESAGRQQAPSAPRIAPDRAGHAGWSDGSRSSA